MDNYTELKFEFSLDKLTKDMYNVINKSSWGEFNQISLTHMPGDKNWFSGIGFGGLMSTACTELNSDLYNTHYETLHNQIMKTHPFTRARLMLLKSKECMSFHSDFTKRIHVPLVTNTNCKMVIDDEVFHMLASDNLAYETNTMKQHTAFNANLNFDRIHILFDLI
jgi:hypothetical protein